MIHWPPVVDELSGLSHYEVRWAGGLWAPVSENESMVNLTMLMDGRYSFEVRAVDQAGNIGPANATWIRVDQAPPTFSRATQCFTFASIQITGRSDGG